WATAADRLARQIGKLEQNLKAHAGYMLTMLQDMHDNFDALEFTLRGKPAEGDPFELYFAYAPKDDLTLDFRVAQRPAVYYQCKDQKSRLFLAGERSGYAYKTLGPVPVPQINLMADPSDGHLVWSFSLSLKPGEEFLPSLRKTLETKWLSTAEGLSQLLVGAVSRGCFPFTVERAAGGIRLKWISPDIRTGQLHENVFLLDDMGKLIEYQSDRMTLSKIRYGKTADVRFKPPEELSTAYAEQPEFDNNLLTKGYSQILKMIIDLLRGPETPQQ
ncbi:MAG: hypothetical protein IT440_02270, partial [Phycisphaeraceae bacterium]|nr:hypothetical protein [Phycisphaeraceae bacterium]